MTETERDELIEETVGLLRRVFRQAVPRFTTHSRSQLPMLHHLTLHAAQTPGGVSQSQLAQLLGVSPAHVTGMVDQLEREHFVRRRRDQKDRRLVFVEATRLGLHIHTHLHKRLAHYEGLFEGWAPDDLRELRDLLRRWAEETSLSKRGIGSLASRGSYRNMKPLAEVPHREHSNSDSV